ncbi:hypothetical protein F4782DRAFT_545350 [Xylaria castorea]|nr:hypothetical protein F4782DRAFT_545350 [Xylaria castorea]
MAEPGSTSISQCSSGNDLSNAATVCQSASSAGSERSRSQQPHEDDVGKQPDTSYPKLSPKTLNSWRSRVLECLNLNNVADVDKENSNRTSTSDNKTDASNPFISPPGSDLDIVSMSISSIASNLKHVAHDETYEMIKTFIPLSHELEDVILPEQCAMIEQHVKKGRHLIALAQAIRFSCEFAFEGDCRTSFKAGIHVYHLGEDDEAIGVELRFKKQLSLDLRKYIARRLLRGLLLRYPTRSFPRTFWVAEGDTNPVEKRAILLINDAVGTDDVYELERKIHNILIIQWWDDYVNGSKVARVQ